MSEKKKQRFTHRHIDRMLKIMGIVYAGAVLVQLITHFLLRAWAPDLEFDGMRYLLYLVFFVGLYVAWRRHMLPVACGLGAILSLSVAYRCLGMGFDATRPFLKWMNLGLAPLMLCIFGWMFVWYPLKLIRRVT
jgi:hypothetical protein